MEDSDAVSNISDDCSRSNLSSLSGLTGYEAEVTNLHEFINGGSEVALIKNAQNSRPDRTEVLLLEDRIKHLSSELQNCLKLNEKYKNRLFDLEHKTELAQHSKFEKLVRENAHLKLQLENANSYIQKTSCGDQGGHVKYDELKLKVLSLEKTCFEKNSHLQLAQSDLSHWKDKYGELRVVLERKLLDEKEAKIDTDTKALCIKELKRKIAEQHVQYQQLLLQNAQAQNSAKSIERNLEHLAKSENWYKEQLHSSQEEASKILDEVTNLKSALVSKELHVQTLRTEVEKWRNNCRNAEYNGLKEKKDLLSRIDTINKELLNINSIKDCNSNAIPAPILENDATINELKTDIKAVQQNMSELHAFLHDSHKKRAELAAQNVVLNKSLMEKLLLLESSERKLGELEAELKQARASSKEFEHDAIALKAEKSKLEIAVTLANREKLDVDNAILTIKETFNKFYHLHKTLKEELALKNKDLLKLQSEKQQLFMSGNWHVCEIEAAKKEISEANKKNQTLLEENGKLICELYNLKSINNNVKRELHDLEGRHAKLEEANFKLSCDSRTLEKMRTETQKQNFAVQNEVTNTNDLDVILNFLLEEFENLQRNKPSSRKLERFLTDKNVKHFNQSLVQNLDNQLANLLKYMQNVSNELQSLRGDNKSMQRKMSKVKKHLVAKLSVLESRIPDLERNMQKSHEILATIRYSKQSSVDVNANVTNLLEEIKHLKALVKVKELEKKEKQKRYDINTHTLLKKVKEHLRGRNAAEKQNSAMQQLYDSACEELATLRFENGSRSFEMGQLQNNVANLACVNEKLKETIVDLESKLANMDGKQSDAAFIEYEKLKTDAKLREEKLLFYERDLSEKNSVLDALQKKLHENHFKMLKQEDEINTGKAEQDAMKSKLVQSEGALVELESARNFLQEKCNKYEQRIFDVENEHAKCGLAIEELNRRAKETGEKHDVYSKEIDLLNSLVSNKTKEIEAFKLRTEKILADKAQTNNTNQLMVDKLKSEIGQLCQHLQESRDGKWFLQRLNNDMKYALQTLSNQNKMLTQQLQSSNNRQEFRSIPSDLLNLPSPNKLDDGFINQLLESATERPKKPLTELQKCLNALKKEMSSLQEEIVEKSLVTLNS